MFNANTELSVSELDFDTLKQSLKDFVKTKTEFTDYNFEGSTLNQLINILTYTQYLNSFYTNMSVNEAFLDTAQVRANVVSNAKKLGYVPQSTKSSKATLILNFSPSTGVDEITVPVGAKFKSIKDNSTYFFQTISEYSAKENNGDYLVEIDVYEGFAVTQTFTYDSNQEFYEILNDNVNLDTLIVTVKENANSTVVRRYQQVDDLTEVMANSEVYYIQENYRERYEIYFGDGVLGKQLEDGNVISISYLAASGEVTNSLQNFTNVGYSGISPDGTASYVPSSIQVSAASYNGSSRESLESIRFNAKYSYGIQNRFVTKNDYLHFLKNQYPFIESIQVWGGEEHDPPVYGKVIIAVKPVDGYVLSDSSKDDMAAVLKSRNVLTIEPIFIDPIFLYVNPTMTVNYDSRRTTLDRNSLFNKIQAAVQDFEDASLNNFGQDFLYSAFVNAVEDSDDSIVSSEISILLEKRFSPVIDDNLSYKVTFANSLKNPFPGYVGCISSTSFKTNTSDQSLYFDDDGNGNLRIYYINSENSRTYINSKAGTVNYQTGTIAFSGIKFEFVEGDELRIFAQPSNLNYTPVRNQIIQLSHPSLNLFDTNTQQLTKSGILDVDGNLTLIATNAINLPVIV